MVGGLLAEVFMAQLPWETVSQGYILINLSMGKKYYFKRYNLHREAGMIFLYKLQYSQFGKILSITRRHLKLIIKIKILTRITLWHRITLWSWWQSKMCIIKSVVAHGWDLRVTVCTIGNVGSSVVETE